MFTVGYWMLLIIRQIDERTGDELGEFGWKMVPAVQCIGADVASLVLFIFFNVIFGH